MDTGEIVGLVFGIILFILLILLVWYFWNRYKNKQSFSGIKYDYSQYHRQVAMNNARQIPNTGFEVPEPAKEQELQEFELQRESQFEDGRVISNEPENWLFAE
jgi:hypothetical protein